MQFSRALILLATSAFALVAADINTVKADVKAIDSAVTKLNNDLQATDGNDLFAAEDVNKDAQALNAQIQQSTTDVNALTASVSESDAKSIISSLTSTETTAKAATQRLATIEPALKNSGVARLAKKDIAALQSSLTSFGNALVSKAPADQQDSANALLAKYQADLAAAADAYKSD